MMVPVPRDDQFLTQEKKPGASSAIRINGSRLLVESLASSVSSPLSNHELRELIFAEVTLRKQRGETFTSLEYIHRFPHLAESLQSDFANHDADDSMLSVSAETHSFIVSDDDQSQTTTNRPEPEVVAAAPDLMAEPEKPGILNLPSEAIKQPLAAVSGTPDVLGTAQPRWPPR